MAGLDRLLGKLALKSGYDMSGFANMILGGCVAVATLAATTTLAPAGTKEFWVLYGFCRQQNCLDGAGPETPLVADNSGNLYGTTHNGGSINCRGGGGCGTVFELAADGTETVLHSFCVEDVSCTDGAFPGFPLILDKSGNLYGTTSEGGAHGYGTVFRLAPDGKETVLHSFCDQDGCADGADPSGGVVMDRSGNLYGTTETGGTGGTSCNQYGCGTVFRITPDGKEKVLYSFCSQDGCADGAYPLDGVVMDHNRNLYGTTYYGGANNSNCSGSGYFFCGTVFKVDPASAETVLYSFCAKANCADGVGPQVGVVLDGYGNLYGTTPSGGNLSQNCPIFNGGYEGGCGTVFEVRPDSTETVLYAFCPEGSCSDGAYPLAGVALKSAKDGLILYGTTEFGGDQGYGTVFSLSSGKEKVLHSLCSLPNCADGTFPQAGVIIDRGSFIGAVSTGGIHRGGTIYRLDPMDGRAR